MEYASGAYMVKSCSEGRGGSADNLSNELTGSSLTEIRMRIAAAVCQLVDLALSRFLPPAQNKQEYAGGQEVRFVMRRRTTKMRATATMIATGMLPLRA
jgi:hypothetical protein